MQNNSQPDQPTKENSVKEGVFFNQWHKDDFVVTGWFLLFFPIGLYGVWKRNNYTQKQKYLFALCVFAGIVTVSRGNMYVPVYLLALPCYSWLLWNKTIYSRSLKMCFFIPTVIILVLWALSYVVVGIKL